MQEYFRRWFKRVKDIYPKNRELMGFCDENVGAGYTAHVADGSFSPLWFARAMPLMLSLAIVQNGSGSLRFVPAADNIPDRRAMNRCRVHLRDPGGARRLSGRAAPLPSRGLDATVQLLLSACEEGQAMATHSRNGFVVPLRSKALMPPKVWGIVIADQAKW